MHLKENASKRLPNLGKDLAQECRPSAMRAAAPPNRLGTPPYRLREEIKQKVTNSCVGPHINKCMSYEQAEAPKENSARPLRQKDGAGHHGHVASTQPAPEYVNNGWIINDLINKSINKSINQQHLKQTTLNNSQL